MSLPFSTHPSIELPESGGRVPPQGTVIAGRYRIEALIGTGGMGAVLGAVDLATEAHVAVKWVLPGRQDGVSRERLLREAKLARRVEHPNVVKVHDLGEDDGSIFLVMELLRGEALDTWLQHGPHDPSVVIGLMMPVIRAIAAAHAAGVVHRDLKPHNVILCRGAAEEGVRPTVIDFGISRGVYEGTQVDLTLTRAGTMVGTPLYMAPEQLAGVVEPDPRADVYALGVMLYELLSAGSPFESETYGLLLSEKLNRDPIPLSAYVDLDSKLERAVMRALERSPERRWSSAAELGRALEGFVGARFDDTDPLYRGPVIDPSTGVPDRVRRTVRRPRRRARWPWVVAIAVMVALASVGVVVGALWALRTPSPTDMEATELPRPEPTAPPVVDGVALPRPTSPIAAPVPPSDGSPVAPPTPSDVDAPPPALAPSAVPRPGRRRGRTGRLSVDDF